MKGENAMIMIEGFEKKELIDHKLAEFIRESERNRILSAFATKNKTVFTIEEAISLICGFEVRCDDGMSLR
jgi:hypothetical protein